MSHAVTQTRVAPCGGWGSPVTSGLVAGRTVSLSALVADGNALYWLEARPAEGGRTALVCRTAQGDIRDVVAAPFDVGSRVHEYGGGAYAVCAGTAVFSDRATGALWRIRPGADPDCLCVVPGLRFADLALSREGGSLFCVREDHRVTGAEPRAAIVRFDLRQPEQTPEGGQVLVSGDDFYAAPRPSPDGRRLAWIAWSHPDMPWDATRLYRAELDATGCGKMASTARLDRMSLIQPVWSPGGVLHVCSDRSGWWNPYRVAADGEALSLVALCPMQAEIGVPPWVFGQRSYAFHGDGFVAARAEEGRLAACTIDGAAVTPLPFGPVVECPVPLGDGSLAWIAAPPDGPAAVMIAHPGQWHAPLRVRTASEAPLDPADISCPVALRFAVADSDMPGHAWWYPPHNPRHAIPAGELPPLIVIGHGGPTAMATDALDLRIQWWTSRGIGVVSVNYGGSTGFGRSWRQRLDGQWGVVDVADCIAAAQALADRGLVDPARIAIRGSSAGGFTALAALTSSDLFAAGASLYGIGDLMLLAGDTHKFESRYLDRLIGTLPAARAVYEARSPIHHLDRLRCPVIFFQGLDDKVVPPAQARGMVDAMRRRGLPVEHHEFTGEGHGFRRQETMEAVLALELAFYGRVFGFTPAAHAGG